MATMAGIFRSILVANFQSHCEPLEVTFSDSGEDAGVRFLDGAQRAMCVLGICH